MAANGWQSIVDVDHSSACYVGRCRLYSTEPGRQRKQLAAMENSRALWNCALAIMMQNRIFKYECNVMKYLPTRLLNCIQDIS